MESSKLWTTAMACAVLLSFVHSTEMDKFDQESDLEIRALRSFYPKDPNLTNEKQLLGALHEVLTKLQTKRISLWEKKFGRVPTCDIGEQCAIRKGSRIGKMCDCPRGALCNYFLLKCL